MLPCPACQNRLRRIQTPHGFTYRCIGCGGTSVTLPVLRKDSTQSFIRSLLTSAYQDGNISQRRCPFCGRPMRTCQVASLSGALELDYCQLCNQVWFDPNEYQEVPSATPPVENELSPETRQALAIYQIQSQKESVLSIDEQAPDEAWQYIPAVLGLPVTYKDTPLERSFFMTWAMSAAMTALLILLWAMGCLAGAMQSFGFIAAQWDRQMCLTILTSFFLHAGVWHLASNLYFFMVFGEAVEDHLGVGKFLLLLLASHAAGLVCHAAFDPRGGIPMVGASGGICGILAYYALVFPHSKLGLLFRYGWILRWVRIPALLALVMFVGLQLLGAWRQSLGLSNVSSFGHLGGLTMGIIAGLLGRKNASKPQRQI